MDTNKMSKEVKEVENPLSISELYHENSKDTVVNSYLSDRPSYEVDMLTDTLHTLVPYKTYPNSRRIELPQPHIPSNYAFDEILMKRRSIRDFSDTPLELATLAQILFHANGITFNHEGSSLSFRAAPSAGALYPVEIYPVVFNVTGAAPGVYHYNVKEHCLEEIKPGNFSEKLYLLVHTQDMILDAAVTLILTGTFFRTTIKYGERGYRFVLLDCGHIMQNVYLSATSLDTGCCTIGGFIDDEVADIIGVDGVNEAPLYIACLGKIDFEKMSRGG